MHAGAEQSPHLLRRHRIPNVQAIDASHTRADPRAWSLSAFGVVRRQPDMTLLGGIQRRHLPSQIVVPRPGAELADTHRHTPLKANQVTPAVSQAGIQTGDAEGVSNIEL
jgi:hypothetical protein